MSAKPLRIEHFIVTRFCIRKLFDNRASQRKKSQRDPLGPEYLAARFQLLKFLTSASLMGQTCRSFAWIVIIDKDLDRAFREQILQLGRGQIPVILHEFDPGEDLGDASWLTGYFTADPDLLITTNIDDDDLISRNFVEVLQQTARLHFQEERAPLVRLYGLRTILLWNLVFSRSRPLGVRSNWFRRKKFSSCGFTLACGYPAVSMSSMPLRHSYAEQYLEVDEKPLHATVTEFRNRLAHHLSKSGIAIADNVNPSHLMNLSDFAGPALMSNHLWNNQGKRLLERRIKPVKVTGPETFPDHAIDWTIAAEFIRQSHMPYGALIMHQKESLRKMTWRALHRVSNNAK